MTQNIAECRSSWAAQLSQHNSFVQCTALRPAWSHLSKVFLFLYLLKSCLPTSTDLREHTDRLLPLHPHQYSKSNPTESPRGFQQASSWKITFFFFFNSLYSNIYLELKYQICVNLQKVPLQCLSSCHQL